MIENFDTWHVLGDHGFERTWRVADGSGATVVKAIALKPGASSERLRLAEVDWVPLWTGFHRPTPSEVMQLDLDPERTWILAKRPEVDGQILESVREELDPMVTTAQIAMVMRDLHEVKVVHGDIQPRNVIWNRDVWLIDVALSDEVEGNVAGSAPFMAPELWEGASSTIATDVYALAALACWLVDGAYPIQAGDSLSDWANAHRDQPPSVPGSIPNRIQGVLRRMLAKDQQDRPPIQHLLDALAAEDYRPEPTSLAIGLDPYQEMVDELCARAKPGEVAALTAPTQTLQHLARRTRLRLEFDGWKSATLRLDRSNDPWNPVVQLAKDLGGSEELNLTSGDQLHVFEQLADLVLAGVDRETFIAFPEALSAGADLRAWFEHLVSTVKRDGLPVTFFLGDDDGFEVPVLGFSDWAKWRANTLRTEVRDISQRRWDQLVHEHGSYRELLKDAIDRELGWAEEDTSRNAFDTAGLVAIGKGWRPRVERLITQCAFAEAMSLCESLWQSTHVRADYNVRGLPDPDEVLEQWTEAAIRGARTITNADALKAALNASESPRSMLLLARLCNSLGHHDEGLAVLKGFEYHPDISSQLAAESQCWRAQLALSSGKFDVAAQYARKGLDVVADAPQIRQTAPAIVGHLEVMVRAPDALKGKSAAIDGLKDLIPELERDAVPAILRARAHSYRAIGLSRNGEFDEATDAYIRALEEIETAGLTGELPTFLLNVGTAYHRQGRLGLAREYYARGTRVAQDTTRASTRALLLANQANVDLALGRFDEARTLIRRAQQVSIANELQRIEVMSRSVEADILLAEDQPDEALAAYNKLLLGDLSASQRAEIMLAAAEALLRLQLRGEADSAGVQQYLDGARAIIDEHSLSDLGHHHGILRARFQWSEGGELGVMAGIELFRRHLRGAHETGNHKLVLREAPHLVGQLEQEGLTELLDEVLEVVQTSRNAIAMGLTRELRRDFFANLPKMATRPEQPPPALVPERPQAPVSAPPTDVEPFYRMLSLNEMILRSESLPTLFSTALDIALSLSGAERGFILQRETGRGRVGDFRVAASRDVDGEPIAKPHLKVSLTIAEEAASTGRTVVTLNAQNDDRFNTALSVVDLDLTSVLCVPIRDSSGLLGAIYVDHRFRPGVFGGEVPRMMEAFGHQVALAISNANRLQELRDERRKLEEANEELDGLLREREQMMLGLEQRVSELANQVERQSSNLDQFDEIAFVSREMEVVLDQVARVSRGDIPVVITGESGVGKELVARAMHSTSPRSHGPFIAFNCGAVSETLFESEVFGHVKGAFTGADYDRDGLFLAASGGTIFLDEIGEMPLSMQVKLLRVLQEGQIRRVGEATTRAVDVRVVAATNRDLWEMVEDGTFREDLYFRLAAFLIRVPPLRERREDVPIIAHKILEGLKTPDGETPRLTPDAARLLAQSNWKGNVRQLENTLRSATVLSASAVIDEADIAPLVQLRSDGPQISLQRSPKRGRKAKASRQDVVEAMRRAGDDREEAAKILGVSVRTLFRYLAKYNL